MASPEIEAQYAHERSSEDPTSFLDFVRSQPIGKFERPMFEALFSLIDHERRGRVINNMAWRILECPDHAPTLLTADRPLIQTSNLSCARAHIILPIGPRKIFVASPDRDYLNGLMAFSPIELAKQANRQVVAGAKHFVWSCDDRQKPFIEKHFGCKPQPGFFERLLAETPTLAGSIV